MTGALDEKRPAGRIADYIPLIRATDGLTLSQICLLSGLETSTIQNWIKRGFVPHPVKKKYYERHLARILLIASLRETMQIDRVGELLRFINGDADDESDDMLEEERLYDVFREITLLLEEKQPAPDEVGELVEKKARELLSDFNADDRRKITSALYIMAYTFIAGRYKQKADKLFTEIIN